LNSTKGDETKAKYKQHKGYKKPTRKLPESYRKKEKTALGWVVVGEMTPRWATG
jgi:hypothetical protein